MQIKIFEVDGDVYRRSPNGSVPKSLELLGIHFLFPRQQDIL